MNAPLSSDRCQTGLTALVGVAVSALLALSPPLAGAASPSAGAQEERASLSGTLLDATGRALSGVPITLIDSVSGQKYETRSDAAGQFLVAGLPAGDYRVEVSKPGFEQVAGRVVLGPGQQVGRDVVPRIVALRHIYTLPAKPETGGSVPSHAGSDGPRRIVVRTTAPDDACKGTTSGGCLTPPVRMVEAWPAIPRALIEKGVPATVEVQVRLGTDGFLTDFRPKEGADPEFAALALEAPRLREYTPLRLNSVPQEARMTVTFQYDPPKR